MDAIKKKMVALREETDRAVAKANSSEAAATEANEKAEEMEEKQRRYQKKLAEKENRYETMCEDLVLAEIKAEDKEKLFQVAEQDIAQLERTIILKEAEVERSEENLGSNTTNMSVTSKQADGADRVRKDLERANLAREDAIEQLENKLKEAKYLAADAERKYEEVARKMNMMENDLGRALNRADNSEDKIIEFEMELKVVGDNMKAMEVSEEKAHQREDIIKDQIRHLVLRLKDAESRAEYGEMNVQRIHLQIDQLEDELIGQKQKCKAINDELQQTFNDMVQMY
eukprot:GFUD01001843.1.p1 GENE.GFUD01001843.1~~GFUD01001843.1.p1  ORF type:complete len:286 (+),score=111.24 GFUD01001843.1:57-914(+)